MEFLTPYSLSRGAPSASRASLRNSTATARRRCGAGRIARIPPDGQSRGSAAGLVPATRGGLVFPVGMDALEDLLAMDGDIAWRGDTQPDLVALDAKDRDRYRVPDHQGLTHSAREDQHFFGLLDARGTSRHQFMELPMLRPRTGIAAGPPMSRW